VPVDSMAWWIGRSRTGDPPRHSLISIMYANNEVARSSQLPRSGSCPAHGIPSTPMPSRRRLARPDVKALTVDLMSLSATNLRPRALECCMPARGAFLPMQTGGGHERNAGLGQRMCVCGGPATALRLAYAEGTEATRAFRLRDSWSPAYAAHPACQCRVIHEAVANSASFLSLCGRRVILLNLDMAGVAPVPARCTSGSLEPFARAPRHGLSA